MQELILLRGLPGSGKSTLAKTLGGVYFEADMYFMDQNNNYMFDPSKLKDAHNWCKNSVMEEMKKGNSRIIVSNTFTQKWEMDPYYLLAKEMGYLVFSIVVENRHNGINEHGVPEDKLKLMKERFEIQL